MTTSPSTLRSPLALLALLLFTMLTAHHAAAQLTPDRTYYGINRAMPMTVAVPADAKGDAQVQLLASGTAEVVEKAPVAPGPIDLADKFPTLWTTSSPRLLYAQLVVGETKIGPAVVLQPMVSPAYARGLDRVGNPAFPTDDRQKLYSGIRAYVDMHVLFETSKGQIEIALRPDVAPNTVWNFRSLVDGGFYTDILVHRIEAAGEGFVIQFGDPNGSGAGGPGYYIDLEPSTLDHDFGVVSMARTQDPNTNGSQIFICLSRNGTRSLDGKYCAFGETVKGAEPIRDIAAVPVQGGRPIDPPMVKSAKLIPAPPYGEGPKPISTTPAPEKR